MQNGAKMEREKAAKNELEELEKEIRKTIADNNKFLEKVLDDDFEPEYEESEQSGEEDQIEEL